MNIGMLHSSPRHFEILSRRFADHFSIHLFDGGPMDAPPHRDIIIIIIIMVNIHVLVLDDAETNVH